MRKSLLIFTIITVLISGCVSPKIHNTIVSDFEKTRQDLSNQEKENLKLSDQVEELNANIRLMKDRIYVLRNDSIQNGNAIKLLQAKFDELNTAYDLLVSQNSRQMSEKAEETKRLLEQLDETKVKLLVKEDELNKLSKDLQNKERELNMAQKDLDERSSKSS